MGGGAHFQFFARRTALAQCDFTHGNVKIDVFPIFAHIRDPISWLRHGSQSNSASRWPCWVDVDGTATSIPIVHRRNRGFYTDKFRPDFAKNLAEGRRFCDPLHSNFSDPFLGNLEPIVHKVGHRDLGIGILMSNTPGAILHQNLFGSGGA